MRAGAARTGPLYVGAFLGPLGGGLVIVLVPQLRAAFHTGTTAVAASMTAYLVPFALLQMLSGTVGERLGRRRVVRAGYVVYAASSALAPLAPGIGAFLALRAVQGSANAFVTPLLLAGLADAPPAAELGRRVGTFAAVQTAAQAAAPLCGGALGAIDWRLAFLLPAAVAAALAVIPPPDGPARSRGSAPPRLRDVLSRRVGLLSAAAFAGHAGVTGLGFLVGLFAEQVLRAGPLSRGLLLALFGVGGVLAGRAAGRGVDRWGRFRMVAAGGLASGAAVALLGVTASPLALGGVWLVAGASSMALWAGLNTLAVEAVPSNRAGGISFISAARFAGSATAPLAWLPFFHLDARLAFLAPAVLVALTGPLVRPLRGGGGAGGPRRSAATAPGPDPAPEPTSP